jgi:ATP phosphoribosyltransferase
MSDSKPVVLNATAFWANLQAVNELSGKYQVDLGGLSPAAVEALESQGISVRNREDDRGNFITVKSRNPIKAYDTSGEEIGALIGNGSQVKAVIGHYDWSFQSKKGRSPSLLKMVVTELSVYNPESGAPSVDLEAAL